MLVMLCEEDYLFRRNDSSDEFCDAVKALKDCFVYARYFESDRVDRVPATKNTAYYDAEYDVVYWIADLAIAGFGVTTKCPEIEGGFELFSDREVQIRSIDCLPDQMPVCYVSDRVVSVLPQPQGL